MPRKLSRRQLRETLSFRQVAEAAGLELVHLRGLRATGKGPPAIEGLPCFRLRFDPAEVAAWLRWREWSLAIERDRDRIRLGRSLGRISLDVPIPEPIGPYRHLADIRADIARARAEAEERKSTGNDRIVQASAGNNPPIQGTK